MYKKILSIIAVSFSLMMSSVLFAESGCGEHLKSSMINALGLDQAQKEKLKPIMERMKMAAKEHFNQMRDVRAKMMQQVQSDTMDQAAVDSVVDQKAKLVADYTKARIAAKHEIYMMLTPEQKTKLKMEMQRVEEKMVEKYSNCQEEG